MPSGTLFTTPPTASNLLHRAWVSMRSQLLVSKKFSLTWVRLAVTNASLLCNTTYSNDDVSLLCTLLQHRHFSGPNKALSIVRLYEVLNTNRSIKESNEKDGASKSSPPIQVHEVTSTATHVNGVKGTQHHFYSAPNCYRFCFRNTTAHFPYAVRTERRETRLTFSEQDQARDCWDWSKRGKLINCSRISVPLSSKLHGRFCF